MRQERGRRRDITDCACSVERREYAAIAVEDQATRQFLPILTKSFLAPDVYLCEPRHTAGSKRIPARDLLRSSLASDPDASNWTLHMSRASIEDMQPSVLGRPTTEVPGIQALPWGFRHIVQRLGICESKRRLLHMIPGLLPALLGILPHRDPWEMPLKATVVAITLVAIAIAFIRERDFARPNETLWHMSVIGYALPVVLLLLLLPGRSEIGLMTLGVLAFGDGSAALGGKFFGGRRLPWNRRKTWAGFTSFLLAGTLAASFNYWVDARPTVPIYVAFLIGGAAAVTGAIAESLPIRSHDNFRVGTTAALTGLFMHVLILGW